MKAEELLYIEDIPAMIEVGRAMQQECEPDIEFDDVEVAANCFACINDLEREHINCWIIQDGEQIIAFGVGRIGKYMFSKAKIASMVFWYVRPEYRKTRASFEILHNFENWATLSGAYRIEVGAARMGVDEANKINGIFKRRGFRPYGELFYREVN